jgi:hypothetical protein
VRRGRVTVHTGVRALLAGALRAVRRVPYARASCSRAVLAADRL